MNRASIALCGALALGTPILTSGCTGSVGFSASTTPTRLVAVSPGVWTVYDYGEPVFYASGSYWWWNGNVWYRSSYVDHGWVYVRTSSVPVVVRRIDQPSVYVHYRGGGAVRSVPPGHVRHRSGGDDRRFVNSGRSYDSGRGRHQNASRTDRGRVDVGRGRGGERRGGDGRGGDRRGGDGRGRGRGHGR